MGKESKKQEVVAKAETAVSVATDMDAWGSGDVSAKDIVIPKILAMQGLSELVSEGKAKFGDFVDSLTHEVIGSIEKPVKFVPFHMEKVWIISKKPAGQQGRYEFDRFEPVTAQNMNRPFEETADGMDWKNEYTMQFYVLRPEDTSIPYVISFKSTSAKSGKVLATQMYVRNRAAGLVPPAFTMLLGGRKEKNDKGTFIVMETKTGEKTDPALIEECLNWYQTIKSGATKVDAGEPAYASEEAAASNF